jgi:pimeloyl-[acyl-carrier protein] methyl ester esterase
MQLVILPVLDGTGQLLTDFTDAVLPFFSSVSVVRYPTDRVLDHAALAQFVRRRLPVDEPFVLLGESFSSPLAIAISADAPARLRGVALSTTFDHQPVPQLARLSPLTTFAPVHWLPAFLLSWALLGSWATPALQNAVTRALHDVSSVVLRERARQAMLIDVRDRVPRISVPLLYLRHVRPVAGGRCRSAHRAKGSARAPAGHRRSASAAAGAAHTLRGSGWRFCWRTGRARA